MAQRFRFFTVILALTTCGSIASEYVAPHSASALGVVTYTGTSRDFTVPTGVSSIHFDISGASGGDYPDDLGVPGLGGSVAFDLAVTAGEILKFEVGGEGHTNNFNGAASTGGYPDGGNALNFDIKHVGSGGGSTRVWKIVNDVPVLVAIAGGGGGSATASSGGDGGETGGNGTFDGDNGTLYNPVVVFRGATGGTWVGGGSGAVATITTPTESFPDSGRIGNSLRGGNSSYYGGAGGGGGYFGGGGGLLGLAGGGGASWSDTSAVTNTSLSTGNNSGNGKLNYTLSTNDSLDSSYSLSWVDGRIQLDTTAISGGPTIDGTYDLYDSATITSSPLVSASVNGTASSTSSGSGRTLLTGTRFALRFTSNNSSYTDHVWENFRVKCGAGSYNATDGYIPCTRAPIGSYVAILGATAPIACPAGSTTRLVGANSCVVRQTITPSMSSPNSRFSYQIGVENPLVSYSLPESPLTGSVKLRWTLSSDASTYREISLDDSNGYVSLGSFDPLAPDSDMSTLPHYMQSETKISGTTDATHRMPPGSYSFRIIYRNSWGDPSSSVAATDVALRIPCSSGLYSSDGYTPCTANTTTTTSTTTSTTSTTAPPLGSTTTTSTSTSTTMAIQVSASMIAKCSVKKGKLITRACLAKNAGITIASTSKVRLAVAKTSSKICVVSGSSVKALKAGTCSVTLSVTPKKGKAKTYKSQVVVAA